MMVDSKLRSMAAGGILLAAMALNCYFDEKPTSSNPNNPNNSRATLSRISVYDSVHTEIPITPAFHPDTLNYDLVLSSYCVVRLSYFPGNEVGNTGVLLDGKTLFSSGGPNDYLCTLNVSDPSKTFLITVTDYDNHDKTYSLVIEARPSTNDSLNDIRLYDPNGVQVNYLPVFESDSSAYATTSPYYGVHKIETDLVDSSATVEVRIDGVQTSLVWFGSRQGYPCSLTTTAKVRTCSITVTAADGITKRSYTLALRRAPALTGLSTLANTANSLSPGFSPYARAYGFVQPVCVDTLTLIPTCALGDEIRINGSLILSGSNYALPILRAADTTAVRLTVKERTSGDSAAYVVKVTWDGWSRVDSVAGFVAGTSVRTAGQKIYIPVSEGAVRCLKTFDGASIATACTLSTIYSNVSNVFGVDSGHVFYFGYIYSSSTGQYHNVLFQHSATSWDTASDSLPANLTPRDMAFDETHRLHVLCSANNSSGLRVKRLSGRTWVDEGAVPSSASATSPNLQCLDGTIFVNFRNASNNGVIYSLAGSQWQLSDFTDFPVNQQVLVTDSSSLLWGFSQDTAVVKSYSGSSWQTVYSDTTIKDIGALAVSGGTPWLLGVQPLRALKLSGSTWGQLGMSDFLGGAPPAFMTVLNDKPYVGYVKTGNQLQILTYQE